MMELKDLSKEFLIRIIANMHDNVQDWEQFGMDEQEVEILEEIGLQCVDYCVDNDGWELK